MSSNEFTFPTPSSAKDDNMDEGSSLDTLILGREKVQLAPGYSQIGWMSRSQKNRTLGIGNIPFSRSMSRTEIAKHNTTDDAWIIIRHKVYNLTPYLPYHPGGVDILKKVLGKDGTSFFEKYHPWVNVDALLQSCWLGIVEQ